MKWILRSIAVLTIFALAELPVFPQSWTSPVNDSGIYNTGGTGQRNGVAVTVFNNEVWAAYTTSNDCSGGNCTIEIGNNGGGSYLGFTTARIPTSYFPGGYAVASSNPSLTSADGYLILAFRDSDGTQYLMDSTDGVNWSSPQSINPGAPTIYQPSLAYDPNHPGLIYIAYMQQTSPYTPIFCTDELGNLSSYGCTFEYNLQPLNFNPSIVFWNGILYMAYEDRASDHCLRYYTSDASLQTFTPWNNTCSEQTSTAPFLAVHNGDLFVAFRTNDSSQKFTALESTDGVNLGNRQQPGFSMDGPPSLVSLEDMSPTQDELVNAFAKSNQLETSSYIP